MSLLQQRRFVPVSRVASAAKEIEAYLEGFANVADTAEGFAYWWLPQQQFETSLEIVRAALESLVEKGVLYKRTSGDSVIYVKAD